MPKTKEEFLELIVLLTEKVSSNDYYLFGGVVGGLLFISLAWVLLRKKPASLKEKEPKEADKAKEEVPQKEEKLEAASVQEETKEETQEVEEKQELQPTTPQVSLSDALKNTRSGLLGRVKGIFSDGKAFDDDTMEELEEVLYTSDLGPKTVETLMSGVESRLSKKEKKKHSKRDKERD